MQENVEAKIGNETMSTNEAANGGRSTRLQAVTSRMLDVLLHRRFAMLLAGVNTVRILADDKPSAINVIILVVATLYVGVVVGQRWQLGTKPYL